MGEQYTYVDNVDVIAYMNDRPLERVERNIRKNRTDFHGRHVSDYRVVVLQFGGYLAVPERKVDIKTGTVLVAERKFEEVRDLFTPLFDTITTKNPGCIILVVGVGCFDREHALSVARFNGMVKTLTSASGKIFFVDTVGKIGNGHCIDSMYEFQYSGKYNVKGWEQLVLLLGNKIAGAQISFD